MRKGISRRGSLDIDVIFKEFFRPGEEPWPGDSSQGCFDYTSIDSTSATSLAASSAKKALTTLNTASLKPPMFRMSPRSGACVVQFGCRSMQINFGGSKDAEAFRTLELLAAKVFPRFK